MYSKNSERNTKNKPKLKLLDELTTKEIHKELERNRNHEIKVVRDGEINSEILIKLPGN